MDDMKYGTGERKRSVGVSEDGCWINAERPREPLA